MLREASRNGHAIGAFSTYNLELTQAICRAAERTGEPVILQAGASAFAYAGRDALAEIALRAASRADVEMGVHLDHSRDIAEVEWCLRRGYTSVMFDGAALPFADNIANTRRAAEVAHSAGAWIEAELGGIAGDEDVSDPLSVADGATDPDQVAEFVDATGVDALAVAVGNVHGIPERLATLDLERLRAIAAVCPVPLVLHGVSGLPDDLIAAAISCGVAKLNVNTELRAAFLTTLRAGLIADPAHLGYGLDALVVPARIAVEEVVAQKIDLFARGRADRRP
jgi:fructose-bisphosphate aldolase class II/tagatose 1,6-diphosphate aldolase GatY/KbaY